MARGFLPAAALLRVYRDQLKVPANDDEFDAFCSGGVSVIRVYWSSNEAQVEADRLNELNGHKGAFYFCQHARVQEPQSD